MPTYQYACTACGHHLEAVQSFTDSALTECPECEGRLRKVFSAVGIVFKGSGFYRTDSRSANGRTNGSGGGEKRASDSNGNGARATDSSSAGAAATKPASDAAKPAPARSAA